MTAGDSRWQWVTVGSSPYQSVAVGDHWSQSLTISDWRHQSTPVGTSRYLSVTVNTSRWQSAPVGTSRYQSVTVGNSRYQSAPVGTSRHQSAPVGTSRHQSAPVGITRYQSVTVGTSRWQSVPVSARCRRRLTMTDSVTGDLSPTRSVDEPPSPGGGVRLLWLPYLALTVLLVSLLAASFIRFHLKNRHVYRKRGELAHQMSLMELVQSDWSAPGAEGSPGGDGTPSGPLTSGAVAGKKARKGHRMRMPGSKVDVRQVLAAIRSDMHERPLRVDVDRYETREWGLRGGRLEGEGCGEGGVWGRAGGRLGGGAGEGLEQSGGGGGGGGLAENWKVIDHEDYHCVLLYIIYMQTIANQENPHRPKYWDNLGTMP